MVMLRPLGCKTWGLGLKPWERERAWNEAVGRRVRTLAHRNRVSLLELSRRAKLPYTTLYGYVNHGRKMPAFAAVKLANALQVAVSELLGYYLATFRWESKP